MSESMGHVLVVDDIADNRGLLVQYLKRRGYTVSQAANGQEALAVVASERIDLILLDLFMPVLDGFDTLARLREQPGFLPVIVVSAASEREERLRALKLGADEFINKPVDPEELALRVRSMVALKKANEALTQQAEELTVQSEELQAQQEELQQLYDQLKHHNEQVEQEVLARTAELQAANEELTAQAEELQSQQAELQTANAQLQELDMLKDHFLSILSHELRTPLNAIMGFASILDDEVAGDLSPVQHSYVAKIIGGTEVLLSLINDLLDMSRIQAGRFALTPEPVRLDAICQDVVSNLHVLAERRHHVLSCAFSDRLPVLQADRQRIFQVLINLVNNAIKFSPEGSQIAIRAFIEGDHVRCEVEDNGVGIAEADLPKLFQRFTQLQPGNTRAASGTGLGLSISKALIEAHGGSIGVVSTQGQGSTFWFTLPLTSAPTPPIEPGKPSKQPKNLAQP